MDSRKFCLKVGKMSVCLVGRIVCMAKLFSEHPQYMMNGREIVDQLANTSLPYNRNLFFSIDITATFFTVYVHLMRLIFF